MYVTKSLASWIVSGARIERERPTQALESYDRYDYDHEHIVTIFVNLRLSLVSN